MFFNISSYFPVFFRILEFSIFEGLEFYNFRLFGFWNFWWNFRFRGFGNFWTSEYLKLLRGFECSNFWIFEISSFGISEIDLETTINRASVPWSFGCTKRRPERMRLMPFYGSVFLAKPAACKVGPETIINGLPVPWSFGCTKRRPQRMKLKLFMSVF